MREYNNVSLVISGLAIFACFYIYNQVKTVEQEMLLSVSNNEKVVLQIKEMLEHEKVKDNEVTESVAELDGSSTIANVKKTEDESKIENDLIKQQQEIKTINQQLAAILKQLSERTSNLSAPEEVAPPLTMAEQQQKTKERQDARDVYLESHWQAGVKDTALSSEVLGKLQEKFGNDNSGVVIDDAQCTDSSCKISLNYTSGGRSPLFDLRTQFLGKNFYFSEKRSATDGQHELTVYMTD